VLIEKLDNLLGELRRIASGDKALALRCNKTGLQLSNRL
jgi:hypothetical protein